jgi:hypothetical protein
MDKLKNLLDFVFYKIEQIFLAETANGYVQERYG